jgi:hypothetical protein
MPVIDKCDCRDLDAGVSEGLAHHPGRRGCGEVVVALYAIERNGFFVAFFFSSCKFAKLLPLCRGSVIPLACAATTRLFLKRDVQHANVPREKRQEFTMISLNNLIEFVFSIVELFTDGSAGKPPDSGVATHLVLVWNELDGLQRLWLIVLMLMYVVFILGHTSWRLGDSAFSYFNINIWVSSGRLIILGSRQSCKCRRREVIARASVGQLDGFNLTFVLVMNFRFRLVGLDKPRVRSFRLRGGPFPRSLTRTRVIFTVTYMSIGQLLVR